MEAESNKKAQSKPTNNKDLMRLERPVIYQIKKSNETQQEYVIRKLMNEKKKPSIGILERSPLLQKLEQMMPIFKKSNEMLDITEIKQSDRIDAKLEQVPDQSSSESDQDDDQCEEKQKDYMIDEQAESHQPKRQNHHRIQSFEQLQINILKYPYPQKVEASTDDSKFNDSAQDSTQNKLEQKIETNKKIIEIPFHQNDLEKME